MQILMRFVGCPILGGVFALAAHHFGAGLLRLIFILGGVILEGIAWAACTLLYIAPAATSTFQVMAESSVDKTVSFIDVVLCAVFGAWIVWLLTGSSRQFSRGWKALIIGVLFMVACASFVGLDDYPRVQSAPAAYSSF